MKTANSIASEAIVLRRTDYAEADRILSVLTPDHGRLSIMAKGVRRPASKLAGGIEPLAVVQLAMQKGRGELWTLTSSRMLTFFDALLGDFNRLQCAYKALKKVNQAAETLQDKALYELLKATLTSLNTVSIDSRITEAWFYAQLNTVLGHGLNLARDSEGNRLAENEHYMFSVDDMAFKVHQAGPFSAGHLKFFKLLHIKTPVVIAHINGLESVLEDCLRLLGNLNE